MRFMPFLMGKAWPPKIANSPKTPTTPTTPKSISSDWYGCDIFLFDVATILEENTPPPPPASDTPLSGISQSIRSKLTKEHTRDPLLYYEITETLGKGSMGWVAKVKKKDHIVGGTARREIVEFFSREEDRDGTDRDERHGKKFGKAEKGEIHSKKLNYPGRTLNRGFSSQYEIKFALKSIRYDRVADQSFLQELKNEVDILKTLDHCNIVKLIEKFEVPGQLFMVLELCDGGDLYTRDPYTEEESARIVSSILSAVSYMHRHNIIHRDLKYENILFSTKSPLSDIKLIDFGLSKKFAAHDIMTESVGTIYTMAPEVLRGRYNSQADMWSIGVIAYMLLSSTMPFFGETRNEVLEKILRGQFDFKGRRWEKVSEQAKMFVSDLLVLDYKECPTAEEAFRYPWLNLRHKASVRDPMAAELERIHKCMSSFSGYSKLKKLALMIIAHQSTTEEIGILRKVFQQFNVQKDGSISFVEFKHSLAKYGYKDSELEEIFNGVAFDGSGKILYTEFIAATIESLGPIHEERIAEAFDRLDCDDSGCITAENLRDLLGDEISSIEIEQIFREASCGADSISYPAFLALWDIGEIDASIMSVTAESTSLDSNSKQLLRNESDATLSRANFVQSKLESERKFLCPGEESPVIDIGEAEKLTERMFRDLSWRGTTQKRVL